MKSTICTILIVTYLLVLASCKPQKDELANTDFGYSYYPIDSGHYVTYQVDSIKYLNQDDRDTATYQVMEMIGDTFHDNENDLCRKVNVYRRSTVNEAWALDKVWQLKQTTTNLQKTEDDLRFIRLVFPQQQGATWNGNQYVPDNDPFKIFKDWQYTYTDTHKPYTINGFNFDSTVTVTEVNVDNNVIEKTLRKAVYAKNVGLIYLEWDAMGKDPIKQNWNTDANKGFRVRMTVIDHN